jgi:hypothetical protein
MMWESRTLAAGVQTVGYCLSGSEHYESSLADTQNKLKHLAAGGV